MSKIDYQKLREIAEKTKIAGEAPVMPFDQRINALNDFMKHFSPDIALASLEAEPVAWMRDDADGREYNARNEFSGGGGGIPLYATPPALVVPHEWRLSNAQAFIERYSPPSVEEAALFAWNACRAAMLQGKGE